MIGKVIEGRYAGANVNKLPDKNVLFIQTEDGTKIALSKSNAISIDDVTDQYPSYGRKVMMVMWNDFETSIIQLGTAKPTTVSNGNSHEEKKTNEKPRAKDRKKKNHNGILIIVFVILFVFVGVLGSVYFINKNKIHNEKIEDAKALAYKKVVEVIEGAFDTVSFNTLTESDFSAIIDSICVTYSEPVIKENTYSLIATYRYDLFTKYYFIELEITGTFDSDYCNVRLIRNYDSETSTESDNSNLGTPEPEIAMPEEVTGADPQVQNNDTNNNGKVSGSNNSILLDEKDYYVEFRGLEDGPSDTVIVNFYVENKSDIDVYIQLYGECINGYAQGISNNCNLIPAGSQYLALPNLHFIINPETLSAYGIETIKDLEFNLVIGTMQYVIHGDTVLYDVPVHLDIQ